MKKHYKVYYVGKGCGCYAEDYLREYLGETYAVSEAKACSQVRYRNRNRKMPNGGYSTDVMGDSCGQGFVEFYYEAVEVD